MSRVRFARALGAALAVLMVLGVGGAPASAAENELRLAALAWSESHVDATTGSATNTLTFKIKAADRHFGWLRLDTDPATALPFKQISYTQGQTPHGYATWISTVGDESTYRYTFAVPRYATTAATKWEVSGFQMADDGAPGTVVRLTTDQLRAAHPSSFTADTTADTAAPTHSGVEVDGVDKYPGHAVSKTDSVSLRYRVATQDALSGTHSVQMTLRGPDSSTRSTTIPASSGTSTVGGFMLPAGSPAGTWVISQLTLTDRAGNTVTHSDLTLAPVVLTHNAIVDAEPMIYGNPVNVWQPDPVVELFVPMASGSKAVSVKLDVDSPCAVGTWALPTEPGQDLVIPIRAAKGMIACVIRGLLITDQNGATAAYGAWYQNGPMLPGIVAAEPPRPSVSSVQLSGTEVDWTAGGTVTASFDLTSPSGPVATWARVEAWGPFGHTLPTLTGAEVSSPAGRITASLTFPPTMPPGQYRITVAVADESGRITNFDTGPDGAQRHATVSLAASLGAFTATDPTRLMDTRNQSAPIGQGATRSLTLPGVPSDATAVVLNVTATEPTAASFLTVWPTGKARPATSNLNFAAGQTVPNLVTVPVANGKVDFYNHVGSVHVIADLFGYYSPKNKAMFFPRTPERVLDTRETWRGNKTSPYATYPVSVPRIDAGQFGSVAVVLNVTVTEPDRDSFLAVSPRFASGQTSNLNFRAGQTVANQVIVKADDTGTFEFTTPASAHVIIDVLGYYNAPWSAGGKAFAAAGPTRLMDTRDSGPIGPGGVVTLPVSGLKGVPANATAITLNVTATEPTASSFLTVWPSGAARPVASSLNFTAGTTVPNLVTVPVIDGKVQFYNHSGAVHVIADLFGYFVG